MIQTISEGYREANRIMHKFDPVWGSAAAHKHAPVVREMCEKMGLKTFLDYGCGKASLKHALEPEGYSVTCYDPGIEEYSDSPEPHDFVVCFDVLEHVEPELINNALADLARVTKEVGIFVISTRPSKRIMADGLPAHRLVFDGVWWQNKMRKFFKYAVVQMDRAQITFLVSPK